MEMLVRDLMRGVARVAFKGIAAALSVIKHQSRSAQANAVPSKANAQTGEAPQAKTEVGIGAHKAPSDRAALGPGKKEEFASPQVAALAAQHLQKQTTTRQAVGLKM